MKVSRAFLRSPGFPLLRTLEPRREVVSGVGSGRPHYLETFQQRDLHSLMEGLLLDDSQGQGGCLKLFFERERNKTEKREKGGERLP